MRCATWSDVNACNNDQLFCQTEKEKGGLRTRIVMSDFTDEILFKLETNI